MQQTSKSKTKRGKSDSSQKQHNIGKLDKEFGLTEEILNSYEQGIFEI